MIDTENVVMPEETAEVQQPEQTDPQVAVPSENSGSLPVGTATKAELTPKEQNLAALRQLKQRAERERDEALRELQQFRTQNQSPPAKPNSSPITIGNDDLVEGRHVQALQQEIEKLRSEMTEHKQYSSTATAEARLKASYPDIDKVVSKENLDILSVQEPELHASIMNSSDFFAKGVAAYKALKRFGIYQDDLYEPDRNTVQQNLQKPRPSQAIAPQKGDSPLSQANAFAQGLTPELKASLLKEMMDYRRNY